MLSSQDSSGRDVGGVGALLVWVTKGMTCVIDAHREGELSLPHSGYIKPTKIKGLHSVEPVGAAVLEAVVQRSSSLSHHINEMTGEDR